MPWWYPWLRATRYMNGAVSLTELLEMPMGPIWRDRILIMANAETKAENEVAKRAHK